MGTSPGNFGTKDATDTLHSIAVLLLISGAREWCGLVWVASVSVSVMQASVKSLSRSASALCSLLAADNNRVGTLATLQLCRASVASVECSSQCSVATPGSVLFILPTNTVTASHKSAVRAVQTLVTCYIFPPIVEITNQFWRKCTQGVDSKSKKAL